MRQIFFILSLCVGFFLTSRALAVDERFSVEIKVDVTDIDASVAREKALNSANRAAITAVARRISTQDGAAAIAAMTDAQLINFIKETSVISEKNSDVRYMADLKIIINEDLLKQYMQEREIPLLRNNLSVLIVPLFREFSGDTPLLWEINNPWKHAWDNAVRDSAVRFIPIRDSAGNTATITAEQAASGDAEALERLRRLTATDDVYVLDATYNSVEGLTITASSLSGDQQTILISGPKSSGDALFAKAVDETCSRLERQLLIRNASQTSVTGELTVLYPFRNLSQWINAEQQIKNLDNISALDVQAMAPGKVQFKLIFTGDSLNLRRRLETIGYRLEDGGNYMILQNIGE